MSRLKVMISVLLGLLAVSAFTSAVASASPPGIIADFYPMKFTGSSGESAVWEVPSSLSFRCTEGTSIEGEMLGMRQLTFVVRFKGCQSAPNTWVTSEGAKTGEVVTQTLEGIPEESVPGISPSGGMLVKPQSGTALAKFTSGGYHDEVKGSILGSYGNPSANPHGYEHTTNMYLKFNQAQSQQERSYYREAGSTHQASLETNWPGGPTFKSLGWGFGEILNMLPRIHNGWEELGVIEW
jgi:hypothetical protein